MEESHRKVRGGGRGERATFTVVLDLVTKRLIGPPLNNKVG